VSTQRRAHDVLEFWFGTRPYAGEAVSRRMRFWFGDDDAPELQPQNDEAIRLRFADLASQAARGDLNAWESSPRRRLALILLLDQFPRHIYRGRARAYLQDRRALELAVGGMQLGADAALDPVERIFFYMPMQHAESQAVQEESVAAFRRLAAEAPAELSVIFADVVGYAALHRDIINRFGRFPHRNAVLGRTSSPEERQWLEENGEQRFGQQANSP
jgi:uncharacterized protein (DUF924 family)